jgi:hypothetical protein
VQRKSSKKHANKPAFSLAFDPRHAPPDQSLSHLLAVRQRFKKKKKGGERTPNTDTIMKPRTPPEMMRGIQLGGSSEQSKRPYPESHSQMPSRLHFPLPCFKS